MYHYRCEIIRVIDGDTVEIDLDLGLSIHFRVKVRLYGINAPEMNTREGKEAKAYLELLFTETTYWSILTYKDRTDKYGRYLGTIYPSDESEVQSVNSRMVKAKHAVEAFYDVLPTRS